MISRMDIDPYRWQLQQFESSHTRWSMPEIDQLKDELNRRSRLDPLWQVCADALGSLQFDVIDLGDMGKNPESRHSGGDLAATNPGGMECTNCGMIFIGAEWHAFCAKCLPDHLAKCLPNHLAKRGK